MNYDQIKEIEPSKFKDLEYTMRLIFNHDDDSAQPHNHSPKILQASHAPATSSRGGGSSQLHIVPKLIRGSARGEISHTQRDQSIEGGALDEETKDRDQQ